MNKQQAMLFLLLLFTFILSSLDRTTSLPSNAALSRCLETFDCGNIHDIPYPFTGADLPSFCGPPEFHLSCRSDFPELNISSVSYRVLQLDPIGRVLTLARIDLWNETCTHHFVNSTFDQTNFRYGSGNENLTLIYGCGTSPEINEKLENLFECDFKGNRSDSYSLIGPLPQDPTLNIFGCDTRVEVPILQSEVTRLTSNRSLLREVLMEGFNVDYSSPHDHECLKCVDFGGQCGFDYDLGEPICFCGDHLCPLQGSTKKLGSRLPIAISAGVGGLALISTLIIYICKKRFRIENGKIFIERRAYHDHNLKSFMRNYGSLAPKKYSYSEVKRLTKSFSNKLGEGGYGVVYKASLPDGRPVAVKVIRESKGSGEEFINEVASISRTSHVNIVTLLGFCYERNKRLLIYEYLSNGSLDNFIYQRGSPNAFCTLEWKVLYQVAIGIARGLEYLHRGCNTRILHLDIKPQNILLDEEFSPKISDFGLAKLCQKKESIVSILGTRGTIGFIAPEIFSRAFGGVSHKADVYSYGMLVLEMVGGRKNYDSGGSQTDELYFPDWIYKDLERGKHPASSSVISEEDDEVVRKMTLVSLWCVQTNPSDRPAMSEVVEMLEGPFQSLSVPPKPSLEYPTKSPVIQLSDGSSGEMIQTNSISR